MIQRIQSVYLSLTTLLAILFLNGTILSFIDKTGVSYNITFSHILKIAEGQGTVVEGQAWPLTIILIMVAVLSLIIIFIFRNRSLQLLLTKILIALVLIMIFISAYYFYEMSSQYGAKIVPGIKTALPVLMLIFSVLAFRGIRKDDQLVKSYDRLR
jgi:hypothetical protein